MYVPNSYKTCRNTGMDKKWQPSWMLSWLPWKPPGCQISTLAKNKLQTSPDTIQPRSALDKICTQISPGTRLLLPLLERFKHYKRIKQLRYNSTMNCFLIIAVNTGVTGTANDA